MIRRKIAAIAAALALTASGVLVGIAGNPFAAHANQGGGGTINTQKCEGQGPDWEDCVYSGAGEGIWFSWYNPSAWNVQSPSGGAAFDVCVSYTGATAGHIMLAAIGTDWNIWVNWLVQPGVWAAWVVIPFTVPGEGQQFGLRSINCDYSGPNHSANIWVINSAGNRYELLYTDSGGTFGWYLEP